MSLPFPCDCGCAFIQFRRSLRFGPARVQPKDTPQKAMPTRLLGGVCVLLHTILGLRLPIHAPAVKRVSISMSTDDQVAIDDDPPPSALAAQLCDLAEALPDHLVCSGSSAVPILSKLDGPSMWARLSSCLPRRALAGGGPTVEDILSACAQAPVGRGTETVVDKSVRRVMETERIAVQWPGLPAALEQVQRELCPWLDLEAVLYKVLVYQEGDFFEWHLDSKKEQAHVMTLTVDCGAPTCEGGGIEFRPVPEAQWRTARANAAFDEQQLQIDLDEGREDQYGPGGPTYTDGFDEEMRGMYETMCKERGYPPQRRGDESRLTVDFDFPAWEAARSAELIERMTKLEGDSAARKKKQLWSADAPGDWCCWSATEEHRVRPVTSGCRVVAVYNVLGRQREEQAMPQDEVPASKKTSSTAPEVQWNKLIEKLSEPALTRALQRPGGCRRAGFLLHHAYNFDTRWVGSK